MGKINKIRIGGIAYDISDLATQEALENEIERAESVEEELKNEDLKIKAIAELCEVEVDKLKTEQSDLSDKVDTKQDTLVSGNNIKTVNGLSLVGSGNIDLGNLSGSSSADAAPIASTLNFTTTEDSVVMGGNTLGGESIEVEVPVATIESAGVMSAEDKHELDECKVKLIKLAGFGTISSGNTGVTGDGQYFVSTYNKKLYVSSKYNSPTSFNATEVPFIDGAIYTYDNALYVYNGVSVVKVNGNIETEISNISVLLDNPIAIQYSNGMFIPLGSTNIGDIQDLTMTVGSTFRCAVIDVTEGDVFLLNVKGGMVGRAYAFLDSENRLIYKADSNTTLIDEYLVIPEGVRKLVVNDNNSGGVSFMPNKFIDNMQLIRKNAEDIKSLQHPSESFDKKLYTQAYIDGCSMVWNADCTASYNSLEAKTDKIKGMKCEVMYTEPVGETKFTTIALISNPNGIHNTKQYWADLNNKPKTHINIKSIHPVFTRDYCNFGIMHEGELFNIPYNGSTLISYASMLPNVKYVYGWEIIDNGVKILLPDDNNVILNNGEYTFTSNKGGVSASITLNINFNDYCGKYCCFEFFNNSDAEKRKGHGQPQITKVQVTQSDGFNIYDNFIRPNGLLGVTPAGFIWHEQASEGYYGYQSII